ncbi:dienelactone hydrolase family protein [Methylobacterium sp. 77]|uniref:dienelactone hydrolase family protein n=1 Tax=Methylobacterium sp. 77 TaxID=1101192 RepID=UPI0005603990|nr:dienelactone hydrolase family protein [Methylobacterium sp. 77]
MPSEHVTILTRDGVCPSHIMTPGSGGSWPGVIFYADAGGIRPAMLDMAQRLADAGYLVLLPDLFYRYGPYGPFKPKEVFAGDFRAILGPLMATTGNDKAAQNTEAFLTYFDTRNDVAGSKAGAVGFCMGGGMALVSAGAYPDRFAVAASYHGGNLANEAPTSPHLFAPKLKAEIYVAAAENDGSYPPAMAERLENSLTRADVRHTTRTYPAAHGWMIPDFPVYNHDEAERGWDELFALFGRTLNGAE